MDNVVRNLGNFAKMPTWTAFFTNSEVERLIDIAGDWTFCFGEIRYFVFNKITDNRIKVTTRASE